MRFELISNDTDTLVGMRLAGISGTKATNEQEAKEALLKAVKTEDVAIVLITTRLAKMCEKLVYELKMKCHKPLIVVIPDSKSVGEKRDSIGKYISEAVGIKI